MLQVMVRTEIILCFWRARGCSGVLRRRRVEEKGLTVFVGHIGDRSSVRCDKAADRLCIIDALLPVARARNCKGIVVAPAPVTG
jgi:hypothetical protein